MFVGTKPDSSQQCNTQSCTECKYSTGNSGTYYYTMYTESHCTGPNASRPVKINTKVSRVVWDGITISESPGTYNMYTYYLNKTEQVSCSDPYDYTNDQCMRSGAGWKVDCTEYSSICRTHV